MTVVHYALEGTTAVVGMDDGKANALSDTMIAELRAALSRAEKEATALVLAGRPDRFCAGFDLRVMMSSPDAAKALLRSGCDLLMGLYGSPLPIIVACTGHALAGGALVLLTADVRIGAAGPYRIGLNEVQIGLPVPVLAMELARDRIVATELSRATLRSQIYGPDEAARVGYIDEVTPASDVLTRAKEVAEELGSRSRMAYSGTKARMRSRTIDHVLASVDADMASITIGA